jgi:hypothetical protein
VGCPDVVNHHRFVTEHSLSRWVVRVGERHLGRLSLLLMATEVRAEDHAAAVVHDVLVVVGGQAGPVLESAEVAFDDVAAAERSASKSTGRPPR